MPAVALSVGDSVRRVVDGLLRGACWGKFLCSRCLVKLTRTTWTGATRRAR